MIINYHCPFKCHTFQEHLYLTNPSWVWYLLRVTSGVSLLILRGQIKPFEYELINNVQTNIFCFVILNYNLLSIMSTWALSFLVIYYPLFNQISILIFNTVCTYSIVNILLFILSQRYRRDPRNVWLILIFLFSVKKLHIFGISLCNKFEDLRLKSLINEKHVYFRRHL